jgi:cryptochrome
LKDVPKKYIFEPHTAPIQDQKKAGVLIRGDGEETEKDGLAVYPKPMFDFNSRREICLQGMKTAYSIGLYGNDRKVLDGTWKQEFDDAAEGPTKGEQGGPGGLDSFEDADGIEDGHHASGTSSKGRKRQKAESPRATRGHKREGSQSTLDGKFKKKAK